MKSIIIAIIELEIDMTTFYTYPESTLSRIFVTKGINPDLVLLQSYISVEVEDLMFEIEAGRSIDSDEPNSQYT